MTQRILIVDDDPHIREVICFALEGAGMEAIEAADGAVALQRAQAEPPVDLIVLDIGLPEVNGLEVCRRLRRVSDVPILFLTARSEEIDRVLGLELGGDDYVVKPFSPRELVARISAILKRAAPQPPTAREPAPSVPEGEPTLVRGPLVIDAERFLVTFAGREVSLTSIEFTILRALAARPGVVLSRERIMAIAYPRNVHVSDRTIDSHVRNIRGKFAAVGRLDAVETVHGVGYRLGAMSMDS